MEINLSWVSLINIIGLANGLFFAITIAGLKRERKATKGFLVGLLITIAASMMSTIQFDSNLVLKYPHLWGVLPPFYFLFGPFLFLYVKALTSPGFRFRKAYLLHFLPFVLNVMSWIPFYAKSGPYKLDQYVNGTIRSDNEIPFLIGVRLLHLLIYVILTSQLLKLHTLNIKDSFSSIDEVRLGWVRWLLWGTASIMVLFVFYSLLQLASPALFARIRGFLMIWEPFLITFLGYKGLTQPEIFYDPEGTRSFRKYRSSTLTPEKAEESLERLTQVMVEEKPYLEADLTLKQLADRLKVSPRHLSQMINENLGHNFYDYVNSYRVEEAKRLLADPRSRKYTILSVAYDSGFNSKSAFNLAFKRHEGITPSQFQKGSP